MSSALLEQVKAESDLVAISAGFTTLNIQELGQALFATQQTRASTYQEFDSEFQSYLRTGDASRYRQACVDTVSEFAQLSQVVKTIGHTWASRGRNDLHERVTELQELEKKKLQLTTQRHLALASVSDLANPHANITTTTTTTTATTTSTKEHQHDHGCGHHGVSTGGGEGEGTSFEPAVSRLNAGDDAQKLFQELSQVIEEINDILDEIRLEVYDEDSTGEEG